MNFISASYRLAFLVCSMPALCLTSLCFSPTSGDPNIFDKFWADISWPQQLFLDRNN
jgi:hypothetical protein